MNCLNLVLITLSRFTTYTFLIWGVDIQHFHKNQLQTYAQKRNLLPPVYYCEREGPPHNSRFKCRVTIGGQTFEGQEFLPTLKDAEHAAAKAALMSILPNGVQEVENCVLYALCVFC